MESNAVSMRLRKAIVEFNLTDAPRGAVTRFCAQNGISRSVFYKIRGQVAVSGDPGTVPSPRSRAPLTTPGRTDPVIEQLVIDQRAALIKDGWDAGPLSVRARLIRTGHQNIPSRATIARIFTRHGLITPQPRKRPRSSYKRFRWPQANDMWQLDGTEWRLDDEKNTKQVIYQVEDDHSRMILTWAIDTTENGETAVKVISDAIRNYGVPVRVLTDNGAALNQSRRGREAPLERYLKAFGVHPISGQVAKPTTQGKNERLHFTLQKYLEAHRPITTPKQLTELLDQFANTYNNERPHQELDELETPAEAYARAIKAPAPQPPTPPHPDKFEPSGKQTNQAHTPRRNRPIGTYQIGGLTMIDRQVNSAGRVAAARCIVYVGKNRIGQTLHITLTDDHLEFFGPDGEALGLLARPPASKKPTLLNLQTHAIHLG